MSCLIRPYSTKSTGSHREPIQKVHVNKTGECTSTQKEIWFTLNSWLYPDFEEFLAFSALRQLDFQEILFSRNLICYIPPEPRPHIRHMLSALRVIGMLWHLFKQIFQTIIRICPVCLCCFNQGKDDSSNLSTAFGKSEKDVPSELCGRAYRSLAGLSVLLHRRY